MQTKRIIKSKYVVFMEDNTRVGNNFEINGRNGASTMNAVDKSSKSPRLVLSKILRNVTGKWEAAFSKSRGNARTGKEWCWC